MTKNILWVLLRGEFRELLQSKAKASDSLKARGGVVVFFCTAEATTINRVIRGGIQFFQNLATRLAYVNNGLQASN
ncbi:MAG: hypothetical protein O7D30_12595 [Rickettsia endosymbiont of Ixodes persulcatus]|nr:hypothetical protein [Rickettsia endosymbiont of Ixodes persulcatus]